MFGPPPPPPLPGSTMPPIPILPPFASRRGLPLHRTAAPPRPCVQFQVIPRNTISQSAVKRPWTQHLAGGDTDQFSSSDVMRGEILQYHTCFPSCFPSIFVLSVFSNGIVIPYDVVRSMFDLYLLGGEDTGAASTETESKPNEKRWKVLSGITPNTLMAPQCICLVPSTGGSGGVDVLIGDHLSNKRRVLRWRGPTTHTSVIYEGTQIGSIAVIKVLQDNNDIVFVLDNREDKIHALSMSQKRILTSYGGLGSTLGKFRSPSGMTQIDANKVLICDTQNHRLQAVQWDSTTQRFTATGVMTIAGLEGPCDVCQLRDSAALCVVDSNGARFHILRLDGDGAIQLSVKISNGKIGKMCSSVNLGGTKAVLNFPTMDGIRKVQVSMQEGDDSLSQDSVPMRASDAPVAMEERSDGSIFYISRALDLVLLVPQLK
eukprot:PhF_6_TR34134/c0_g1_i1/m.49841